MRLTNSPRRRAPSTVRDGVGFWRAAPRPLASPSGRVADGGRCLRRKCVLRRASVPRSWREHRGLRPGRRGSRTHPGHAPIGRDGRHKDEPLAAHHVQLGGPHEVDPGRRCDGGPPDGEPSTRVREPRARGYEHRNPATMLARPTSPAPSTHPSTSSTEGPRFHPHATCPAIPRCSGRSTGPSASGSRPTGAAAPRERPPGPAPTGAAPATGPPFPIGSRSKRSHPQGVRPLRCSARPLSANRESPARGLPATRPSGPPCGH